MVVKEIRALKDTTICTRIATRMLSKGEIAAVEFESENEFKNLLVLKSFEEYGVAKTVDERVRPAYRGDESQLPADEQKQERGSCPSCGADLVPGTDEDGAEVMLCTSCEFTSSMDVSEGGTSVAEPVEEDEETVEELQEEEDEETVEEVPTRSKHKKQSRCPICKRIKKRTEKYCKKCTADMTP